MLHYNSKKIGSKMKDMNLTFFVKHKIFESSTIQQESIEKPQDTQKLTQFTC